MLVAHAKDFLRMAHRVMRVPRLWVDFLALRRF